VTSKRTFTFSISDELKAALTFLRERDGIAEAEQIRRGIALWLESKGVTLKKAAPRRGSPRRRA
jgi:hypothetical protein